MGIERSRARALSAPSDDNVIIFIIEGIAWQLL